MQTQLSDTQMRRMALTGARLRLTEIESERTQLQDLVRDLADSLDAEVVSLSLEPRASAADTNGHKQTGSHMSAAARHQQSVRMKRYWSNWRKAHKAGKPKTTAQ